jgi:hypothetical protein
MTWVFVVGAASSRDWTLGIIPFIAAGSRSHNLDIF